MEIWFFCQLINLRVADWNGITDHNDEKTCKFFNLTTLAVGNLMFICIFDFAAAFGAILHVISTSLLGITAITMANTIAGEETVHKLASLLLIVLGGCYVLLFMTGRGSHSHSHNQPMEKMAVAGLVLVPALSPCATTLPVFLAVGNSSSMMILAIIVLLFRYQLYSIKLSCMLYIMQLLCLVERNQLLERKMEGRK